MAGGVLVVGGSRGDLSEKIQFNGNMERCQFVCCPVLVLCCALLCSAVA